MPDEPNAPTMQWPQAGRRLRDYTLMAAAQSHPPIVPDQRRSRSGLLVPPLIGSDPAPDDVQQPPVSAAAVLTPSTDDTEIVDTPIARIGGSETSGSPAPTATPAGPSPAPLTNAEPDHTAFAPSAMIAGVPGGWAAIASPVVRPSILSGESLAPATFTAESHAGIVLAPGDGVSATVVTNDATPVSATEIDALRTAVEQVLAKVQSALANEIFKESLPFLGGALGSALAEVQNAVGRFQAFENSISAALDTLKSQADTGTTITTDIIKAALNGAAQAAGFSQGVDVTTDLSNDLVVNFLNSDNLAPISIPLDSSFGLPGLGFKTSGNATTTLGYTFSGSETVTASGALAFALPFSSPGGALALTINVTPTIAGTADLGFLKFTADSTGTSTKPSSLTGTFTVDTLGDATFKGGATLGVALQTDLGSNAYFPSIGADLTGSWTFAGGAVDPNDPASFGNEPTIDLSNVTYDFGSFVNQFLTPIFNEIDEVIKPIQPALNIFNFDLTPLFDALLGSHAGTLDVAGNFNPLTQDVTGDGKITLLDLLDQQAGQGGQTPALVKIVSLLNTIENFANTFGAVAAASAQYSLGSFQIPGADDIRKAGFDIAAITPQAIQQAQSLSDFLTSLSGLYSAAEITDLQQFLGGDPAQSGGTSSSDSVTLDSPLIDNPTLAAEMILGGQASDLFTLAFNAAANATQTLDVPVFSLGPIASVDAYVNGAIGFQFGLDFGYDTSGLSQYMASDFSTPSSIFNGFYVANPSDGSPVLGVDADIGLGVGLSVLGISVSGGGDIAGNIGLKLDQDGKVYLQTLAAIVHADPLSLFDVSGAVTAGLNLTASLGPFSHTLNSPRVTLIDFDIGSATDGNGNPTATVWGLAGKGYFDIASYWQAPFTTSGDGEVRYYGASTITANATVSLYDTRQYTDTGVLDDLSSLTILNKSSLDFDGGWVFIEGPDFDPQQPAADSINIGTLAVDNIGTLSLNGSLDNIGTVTLGDSSSDFATVNIGGPVRLYGGGTITGQGNVTWGPFAIPDVNSTPTQPYLDLPQLTNALVATFITTAELINDDNTISGSMDFSVSLANSGTIDADSAFAPIEFFAPGATVTNTGLLETSNHYGPETSPFSYHPDDFGQLDIEDNTLNYGGTILASEGGTVTIGRFEAVTIHGGLLKTTPYDQGLDTGQVAPVSAIKTSGSVTFDGGPTIVTSETGTTLYAGLDIEGTVDVGGTLVLTGLIDDRPVAQTPGAGTIVAATPSDVIQLNNALIEGGEYDAIASGTSGPGTLQIVQKTTVDSSLTAQDVTFGGRVQIMPGGVLTLGGEIATSSTAQARVLVNFGTVVVGLPEIHLLTGATNDIKDTAALTAEYPQFLNSSTYVQGDLKLVDGGTNLVTGFDAGSVLRNDWTIEGAGTLGAGTLQIVNEAATTAISGLFTVPGGLIDADATHALIVNGGARGVVNQSLMEATNGGDLDLAGNVANVGGTIAAEGGAVFIDGATIAGGLLTASLGLWTAGGKSGLDGSASALTVDFGVVLIDGPNGTLTLNGEIVNHGTIQIQGGTAGTAVASDTPDAVLTGGGAVILSDPASAPGTGAAVLRSGLELDNVDNSITGTGLLTGDVTNETAGVIASGAGVLSVTGSVANAGLMESTSGELFLDAFVQNLQGTVAAEGGQVVLAGGTISNAGGLILLSNGSIAILPGTIEAMSSGGKSGTVTLSGVVQGGFIATDTMDPQSLVRAGASGGVLDGGKYTVTLAQGSHVLVGAGTTLTLDGAIANLGTFSVIGNSGAIGTNGTAEILISGATTLSGGGLVALSDGSGAGSSATQIVTGANTASLDNIDNTISGVGQFGSASVAIINEIKGRIVAGGGTLLVNGGSGGLINRGGVTATAASEMILAGNVFDAGDSLVADGGTLDLRGTIAGGGFATPNGGQIWLDSGELDGRANTVTIPLGVTVAELAALPAPGVDSSGLEGTIANQGEILLQSDSSKAGNQRSILLSGLVHLTGAGLVSLSDLSATGTAAADAILGSTGADTLDNVDNRIVGFGTIGGTGNAALTLTNETAGTIDAAGGQLFLRVFGTGNKSSNQGLIEAVGGTLDLSGTIANAGGTIGSFNDGAGHTGTVLIDGFTIQGGLLSSDQTDRASLIAVTTKNGTLDGSATEVSLASGAQVEVGHDTKLTMLGSIADQGTIEVIGMQSVTPVPGAGDANLVISGTVTLSGAGDVVLSHVAAAGQEYGNAIIAGTIPADTLNNAVTISGSGTIGNLALTLNNLSPGVISASTGTLLVDTGYRGATGRAGSQPVANTGLLTSDTSGVLDLQSDIANTGGTIGANRGGVTYLDNNIVTGGTFDGSAGGQVLGNYATIDGRTSSITLLSGAIVGVHYPFPAPSVVNTGMTLEGNFVNHGTILDAASTNGTYGTAYVDIAGGVTLSGGGQVALSNGGSGAGAYFDGAYIVDGVSNASDTLDNFDNVISGNGQLGNTQLLIENEAAGIISASSAGTLLVNTLSSNSIPTKGSVVNKGTMRAIGGVLYLSAGIDNRGGTIEALNDGAGHSGTVMLNNGAIAGGVLAGDPNDPGSFIEATNYQTTLDGTSGAVTLAAGSPLHIVPDSQLAMTGTIDNLGTVSIYSNSQSGVSPEIYVTGTVVLTGGGRVSMGYTASAPDYILGGSGSDLLDNVNNTIIGSGRVGFNHMSLTNEAAGTLAAQGGTLDITLTYGGDNFVNQGLLEALGGVLSLQGTIANSGGTILARSDGAGHSGTADLISTTVQGGVLGGDPTDPASLFVATNRSTLDGTSNTVTVAKSAQIQSESGTLTLKGTIADQGTITLPGSGYYGGSTLQVAGTVSLGGGGVIALTDSSGAGLPYQVVGGTTKTDTLDNTGVTIEGVGQIGGTALTLINEAGGSIIASGGTLYVGASTTTNSGLMWAVAGGVLDITSAIANTGGTIGGGGGVVLVDNNGTISGGTLNGQVAGYYGTIDGSTNAVTVAAGATLEVISTLPNQYSKPFYLKGTIVNSGELLIRGDDSAAPVNSDLIVIGTVTLNGGGLVSLSGATAKDTGTATYLVGSSTADTLDNVDNTIAGFGRLGNGAMTLINDTAGTINASGGTLTTNTGAVAITNKDLMTALTTGILDLRSDVANAGGTIGAAGGVTDLDGITVRGGALSTSSGGTILVVNKATLDGSSNGVALAAGAMLAVGTNTTLTLSGVVANHGTIVNNGSIANSAVLTLDGMLINNGVLSGGVTLSGTGNLTNRAGRTVPGAVAAAAAGETISNLGTISGAVSLAGGDVLVTGSGAVFASGITGGSGGNTLEIASGPYTLTNFNAPGTPQYNTLRIDAGVTLITDSSDNLNGIALDNEGAIDLTAFEASSPFQNAGEITGDITLDAGVPVTNSAGGVISGNGLAAIEVLGPAVVTNAGLIDPAAYGVDFKAGGTVINAAGGTIDGNVAGVLVTGGAGTVITGGSIIGGGVDAVSLAAGYANRVILDPGAAFTGLVDGGNSVGGPVASVLELGGVAGSTTLTGLGSQLVDFSSVAIDPGAYVLLSGANTLGAGVALAAAGEFTINGGASLTEASAGVVSSSLTTVDGVGSSWNAAGGLVLGGAAGAALVVSGNGSFTAAGSLAALVVGSATGETGALTVTGTGSRATLTGQLTVGEAGGGVVTVTNQGTALTGGSALAPSAGIDAATASGSTGTIAVTGTQSLLHNTGAFVVGDAGLGHLAISGGGTVVTGPGAVVGLAGLVIGATAAAAGSSAEISGAGSRLDVAGLLDVGIDGSASLFIAGGATVSADALDAANLATAAGEVTLSDPGTALIVSGDATVSDDGTGVLSVLNGASFSARSLTIGSQSDSSGALIVSGDNTTLTVSGELNIGTANGTGDLTVGPNGAVHAGVVNLQGQAVIEGGVLDPTVQLIGQGQTAGGFGTISAGDIIDEGVIQAGQSKASQRRLLVQGTVVGGGTLTINGTVQPSKPAGVLQINAGGTLELTGAVLNAATTTFTDNLTPADTYTVTNSVMDVNFADAAGVLILDDIAGFTGTIATWQAGDRFLISGGTLAGSTVSNGDTLQFSDSGVGAGAGGIDQIIFASPVNASGFNIVNGDTVQVACFAEGTRIATSRGPVAVEDLTLSDHAVLAENVAGTEPIVWIGQRLVICEAHPLPRTVWPVRVAAEAFGPGRPVRDLWLSPDHAVFVNRALVPVRLLINGTAITQVSRERVRYFHVELPRHAVILAEALPVESYLDIGDRATFNQGNETIRLFPDFRTRPWPETALMWETQGAARLVMAGEGLAAAKRAMTENAK